MVLPVWPKDCKSQKVLKKVYRRQQAVFLVGDKTLLNFLDFLLTVMIFLQHG